DLSVRALKALSCVCLGGLFGNCVARGVGARSGRVLRSQGRGANAQAPKHPSPTSRATDSGIFAVGRNIYCTGHAAAASSSAFTRRTPPLSGSIHASRLDRRMTLPMYDFHIPVLTMTRSPRPGDHAAG